MTTKQTCIRFAHPCGERTASQWRQALLGHSPEVAALLEGVAVFQSETALSFTAQQPETSARLREAGVVLMRTVAAMAGRMLDVEMLELTPSVARTGYRWRYHIPRLVVARSADNWEAWRETTLDAEHQAQIRGRIQSDLQKQIQMWGESSADLDIDLESVGVPMVLKNAVSFGPKPVSAMSRKGVMFSSAARIEGAFWAGLLQATGHGRIYRDGYQSNN